MVTAKAPVMKTDPTSVAPNVLEGASECQDRARSQIQILYSCEGCASRYPKNEKLGLCVEVLWSNNTALDAWRHKLPFSDAGV